MLDVNAQEEQINTTGGNVRSLKVNACFCSRTARRVRIYMEKDQMRRDTRKKMNCEECRKFYEECGEEPECEDCDQEVLENIEEW